MLNPRTFDTAMDGVTIHRDTPVHFVGVGGIGMSGLARVLCQAGFQVSGSDLRKNAQTDELTSLGARIHQGHSSDVLPQGNDVLGLLVVSTAIDTHNPEYVAAQERGWPIIHRSQMLREILQNPLFGSRLSVGVSGSHGKTSTTGMIASGLDAGGSQPTAVAGGVFPKWQSNAVFGGEQALAVAELDESDGSLIYFTPDVGVLLNLEMDHAEHFPGGLGELKQTLHQFVENIRALSDSKNDSETVHKTLVVYTGCQELVSVITPVLDTGIRIIGVGRGTDHCYLPIDKLDAHVVLSNIQVTQPGCYGADVTCSEWEKPVQLAMTAPGEHQCLNGAIALTACWAADNTLDLSKVAAGISAFGGMGRRYEVVGRYQGALLVDDYAHHPTEVKAMLAVGIPQAKAGNGRFIAVFQPHRYTRLRQFWDEFMDSLRGASDIIVTDVYEASEPPLSGISGKEFANALKQTYPNETVRYVPHSDWGALKSELKIELKSGDVVMSIGAGDITSLLRNWGDPVDECDGETTTVESPLKTQEEEEKREMEARM